MQYYPLEYKIPTEDSLARASYVKSLPKGAHIYLAGICGTGMASVATLLNKLGYVVSGSDKAFYPPMGDVVKKVATKIYEGYNEKNLAEKPDLVVIGNNLRVTNPEVQFVLNHKIPYASMPEVLQALLVGDHSHCQTSIVVIGTHGKTTTTAAIATMLHLVGKNPGYFIGGAPIDLEDSVSPVDYQRSANDRVVVLEGDEYDSAFFAKYPKFHSYRPDIVVMTSLEFDHADIYNNVEEIELEFSRLAKSIPDNGYILICSDSERLVKLSQKWKQEFKKNILTYGQDPQADFYLEKRERNNNGQVLTIKSSIFNHQPFVIHTSLTGEHNALNLTATAVVGKLLSLTEAEMQTAISQFHGVKRRQQIISDKDGILLIEDFAHHPTAVKVTLDGLREKYPHQRIIAAFEPRSNTSRRGFFQEEYKKCFGAADVILILEIQDQNVYSNTDNQEKPLHIQDIVTELLKTKTALSFQTVSELANYINANKKSGDVIVCMSNGDFGGLITML